MSRCTQNSQDGVGMASSEGYQLSIIGQKPVDRSFLEENNIGGAYYVSEGSYTPMINIFSVLIFSNSPPLALFCTVHSARVTFCLMLIQYGVPDVYGTQLTTPHGLKIGPLSEELVTILSSFGSLFTFSFQSCAFLSVPLCLTFV